MIFSTRTSDFRFGSFDREHDRDRREGSVSGQNIRLIRVLFLMLAISICLTQINILGWAKALGLIAPKVLEVHQQKVEVDISGGLDVSVKEYTTVEFLETEVVGLYGRNFQFGDFPAKISKPRLEVLSTAGGASIDEQILVLPVLLNEDDENAGGYRALIGVPPLTPLFSDSDGRAVSYTFGYALSGVDSSKMVRGIPFTEVLIPVFADSRGKLLQGEAEVLLPAGVISSLVEFRILRTGKSSRHELVLREVNPFEFPDESSLHSSDIIYSLFTDRETHRAKLQVKGLTARFQERLFLVVSWPGESNI